MRSSQATRNGDTTTRLNRKARRLSKRKSPSSQARSFERKAVTPPWVTAVPSPQPRKRSRAKDKRCRTRIRRSGPLRLTLARVRRRFESASSSRYFRTSDRTGEIFTIDLKTTNHAEQNMKEQFKTSRILLPGAQGKGVIDGTRDPRKFDGPTSRSVGGGRGCDANACDSRLEIGIRR